MGKQHRLNRKNAVYTAQSGTTRMINYDDNRQILEVEFIDGDVYHYLHVPASIWNTYRSLIKAGESSGKFVNKEIKLQYKYIKID